MTDQEIKSSIKDSFIDSDAEPNKALRFLKRLDFFSFIPVPVDQPVSTKRSLIGSVIFIILFLIYIAVDLYQFLSENPPIIENHASVLD